MKKLYATHSMFLTKKHTLPFLFFLFIGIISIQGQVREPFSPRVSNLPPSSSIYTVKGDFQMIGNTNLTLVNYNNNSTNNNDMRYVDIDSDTDNDGVQDNPGVNNTWNSSSATLNFSTENGALPECSNILYAGLYWFGRANVGADDNADGDNNPNTFRITKGSETKDFDKTKVLLNGPGANGYEEIQASVVSGNDEIYFPSDIDQNIYTAFADITAYVNDTDRGGIGEYFVADMALREGSSDQNGLTGGWGIVVVYENSKMNWRDITVFDGHAFVGGNGPSEIYSFDVNGFNAALGGDVNIKLGVMASEGERGFTSDYLEIEVLNTDTYQRLTHPATNSDSNFFTSSILTGGNIRNPSLFNNTGVDILMFDIPNAGNSVITNGQSSTSFRYGSSSDGYAIFNVTFSVDAYVPEPVGVLTNTTINGNANPPNLTLEPGGNADFDIQLTNRGTEAIIGNVLTIPIPANVDVSNLSFNENTFYTPLVNYSAPIYDPDTNLGPNGAIVWNLGRLPLPTNPDTVLADISFRLTATLDCSILNDPDFVPTISTNGFISGTGEISGISFNTPLIKGFEQNGLCIGEPIPTPIIIDIDYVSFVSEPPTADTPDPINVECPTDISAPDTSVVTNVLTNSGNPAIIEFVSDTSDNNTCPEVITRRYSVTDDCGNTIFVDQIITINITSPLSITEADGSITVECIADATETFTLPTVIDACGNTLTPSSAVITENPDPLTCEGTRTYTYTYTDCAGNSDDWVYIYTIDLLEFTLPANDVEIVDNLNDVVVPTPPIVNDNCGNTIVPTGPIASTIPACQGVIVYTFTYTDCSGYTADWTYTYTLELTPFTAPDDEAGTVSCIADAISPTPPVVTDSNGSNLLPSAPTITESPNPLTCEGTRTYTFTYTDCAGNSDDWAYVYTIDTPAFTITDVDGSSTVECIADATETFTLPTVTDSCSNTITPSTAVITESPTPLTCEGIRTYTYTYTDCAGNSDDWAYTYTIETPTFTIADVDGSSTVECIADATETFTLPTVTDACGNTLTPSSAVITENPDPLTCEGTRTYTYTYTDCNGNSDDWVYIYTIDLLEFTLPANDVEIVDNLNDVVVPTPPIVNDNCGNTIVPTGPITSTIPACQGAIVYTFTYTDCSGYTADWTYTYTLELTPFTAPDDEAGTVSCIADAISPTPPVVTDSNGSNLLPSAPTITESPNPLTCEGTRTYTFTYTDCAGNSDDWAYVYTIDTPAFTITDVDGSSTVECIADATETFTLPTVTDSCGNTLVPSEAVITQSPDPMVCEGTRTYTYTYTDCVGNSDDWTYTYSIKDNTAPVLTLPANATAECSDDLSPIDFGTATASDNCDDAPTITFEDVRTDGACSGTFTIERTWTATDVCGNTASAIQMISTSDTTAPIFGQTDLPVSLIVECGQVPDAETLTASDNCGDAIVTVEDLRIDGDCDNNYVIERTYTATDDCGLTNTHIQTITVQDTTPPTFDQPLPEANITVECDAVPEPEDLTATDSCSLAFVTVSDIRTDGDCKNNYIISRTWVAIDDCDNTTSYTQIITIQDTKAPEFIEETLPGDIIVECDAIPNPEDISAIDNCGETIVSVIDLRTDGNCPSNYVIARTWIATDECGLTTSHTQNIIVQDTKAPIPTTTYEPTLDVSCTDVPDAPLLDFTDNCSANVIVEFNEVNTFDDVALQDYQIIRTWTVNDACNNKEVYTQTLNVTLDEIFSEVDTEDRCFEEGVVDLNNYLPSTLNTDGQWEMIEGNPDATLNGSIFDPTVLKLSEDFLPGTGGIDYKFRYSTTDMGCISITEVVMNIHADCVVLPCGENDIVISKAITPNGDGYNDTFDITGIDLCGFVAEVKVFNRWGALVYESSNYTLGSVETSGAKGDWDGSSPSSSIGGAGKLPNGTYYFIISLKNSGLSPLTGPVYLGTK
ncbi:gliding motility-associated C-terminal domain-containing protein [uncultured Algibacter sp.]|uniref:HYR-like domain-containing protein n=1 Tax=uncultured Algibacter sp. TaxID=298659 RepID=UPI002622D3DC|nr:gliding motility-associated C-terminal domain-containing protein [uncultured Algibacter sp.]